MIHVAIPDTQTLVDTDGLTKYDAFNIHINGAYHASTRYSHLLRLHHALKREFNGCLPSIDFPSKKLRKQLDTKSLAERRCALARYLQAIIQFPDTSRHRITEQFFLNAQMESFRPSSLSNINLEIYMCDGTKQLIRCSIDSSTSTVLEIFCRSVGVSTENIQYFGLFLIRQLPTSTITMPQGCRLLRNFESPYISLHLSNHAKNGDGILSRLVVRKLIWDTRVESALLDDDAGAVNLLYVQAASDLDHGSFVPPIDVVTRLRDLQRQHSWKQFLRLCYLQPTYCYEYLVPCVSDYPCDANRCELLVGRRQLVLQYPDMNDTNTLVQSAFRATRIRVWKIVNQIAFDTSMIFQFEYLVARDRFEWITLYTDQAVLLSLFLQSIGMEILREQGRLTEKRRCVQIEPSPTKRKSPISGGSDGGVDGEYESFRDVLSLDLTTNESFSTITDDDL